MNQSVTKRKLLNTELNGMFVCIDVQYVEKALPLMSLEQVPGGPIYLVGLMNYTGQSIPVIDLSLRLNLPRFQKYTLNNPILLCRHADTKVGIIIDKMPDLLAVNESEIQMNSAFEQQNSFYLGAVNINHKLSLLLDIKKILSIGLIEMKEYD